MVEADSKLVKSCSNSIPLAFKPRQVLLAQQKQHRESKRMAEKQKQQLNHKAALTHSILRYLQKNGFSKTFKWFLKEAQIEEDNLTTSIDLEDVYSRYFETSKDADKQSKTHKEQDFTMENGAADLSEEAVSKMKKKAKKGLENDGGNGKEEAEETSKSKEKKDKQKPKSVSVVEDNQKILKNNKSIEDCMTENNKRKKKKEVEVSQKASDEGKEMADQGKSTEASEGGNKKKSKKRKLSASDEIQNKNMEKSETGESKRRKTEDSEEAKVGVQQGDLNEQKNVCSDQVESLKLSNKEVDGSKKEVHKDNGTQKSAGMKSARKQQNDSAEPKTTANAFQRVKADEVQFADDRLQDNSYWAKAGAENGYGAKAQEILGQVKGRDFRHEKTKKKRGSYRGGQIDFGSHSIKFNYDDE